MWPVPGSFEESWIAFRDAMGLSDPQPGQSVAVTAPGALALFVEIISFDGRVAILKVDQPAPGLAWLAHPYPAPAAAKA